ncbi:peroxidasin homolog [Pollicipes pollicipes]|uniref:peroxidasin homolog n=1 Tax=Pollicipes pollicipes TaxID=41117 RepID=UPI001884FB42|nr:peroxidasin homolog [Pollicipes pollicipes]
MMATGRLLIVLGGLWLGSAQAVVPPAPQLKPEFLSQPGLFSVREGDAVVLPCSVRHAGTHSVVWQQGKRVLTARHLIIDSDSRLSLVDGHNLRIDRVGLPDAGNFTCSVSSKPLMELTHTVDVLWSAQAVVPPAPQLKPEFLSQPGLFSVREGDAVVLPCSVRHAGTHSVVWQQGKRVLTARHLIIDSDSRLSLVDGHNLRIDRVGLPDAGNFTCSVSSKPLMELTHTVDVLYGPVVKTLPKSGQLTTDQGQNVTLQCGAEGNPQPDVAWRKQVKAQMTHLVRYRSAQAVVPPAPQLKPEFLSQPGLFSVREGDAVVLPCSVRHAGTHSVVWQQGKRVLTARHLIIDSDSRLSLVDGHNLRIDRVGLPDAGNFTCSVSSKPLMELTHTVDVLYGPVVKTLPKSGQLTTDQGQNVTLQCGAEGNPQPDVAWRKQHGRLPSGGDHKSGPLLRIYHISREMAGVYECEAENGLGTPGVATVSVHVHCK